MSTDPTERGEGVVLEHVTRAFGDVVAVKDASFSIHAGEFFSMLGPSGCGKSFRAPGRWERGTAQGHDGSSPGPD